ncbi:hypothetical protein ACQPZX_16020 [Actinoplanes sp. CA-142083]|uniref:hypothetical protein n=1 Tax=Actinoplanes sp. CA-142083 TaxID=3239903 RepID=UPI003D8EAD95
MAAAMVLAGATLAPGTPAQADSSSNHVTVPADGSWVDTGIDVTAGGSLEITAWGRWRDGAYESGPSGSGKAWPDNFFNLSDIGFCGVCARTMTPRWGALEGYVGYDPPAPGSYTSPAVFPRARKVFFVGAIYEASPQESGRLWLNKNADAYSNYTVDNSGSVTAHITASTPWGGGSPEIPQPGGNPVFPPPTGNPQIPLPTVNPGLPNWYCLGGVPGSCNHPG